MLIQATILLLLAKYSSASNSWNFVLKKRLRSSSPEMFEDIKTKLFPSILAKKRECWCHLICKHLAICVNKSESRTVRELLIYKQNRSPSALKSTLSAIWESHFTFKCVLIRGHQPCPLIWHPNLKRVRATKTTPKNPKQWLRSFTLICSTKVHVGLHDLSCIL